MNNIGIDAGIFDVSNDPNRYNARSTEMVIMYKHAKVYCPVALHIKHNVSIHELTIKRDSNSLGEVQLR